jgi:carbon monoxide dehydrogenase subunit G
VELTHRFSVPTTVEETWAHFADLAAVAECFPGAQLTSADDESFHGSVKVKLGPIALQYNGSGTFLDRDDEAHRFVIDAKGKDKRGNGTAGATVTLSMAPTDVGTDVDVVTDLSITGKPAQFGRGVMQDVSDKLLGQFVNCLETRLGAEPATPVPAGSASPDTAPEVDGTPSDAAETRSEPPEPPAQAEQESGQEALDLGATVLPVLAKAYWKHGVALVVIALVVRWLVKRR